MIDGDSRNKLVVVSSIPYIVWCSYEYQMVSETNCCKYRAVPRHHYCAKVWPVPVYIYNFRKVNVFQMEMTRVS